MNDTPKQPTDKAQKTDLPAWDEYQKSLQEEDAASERKTAEADTTDLEQKYGVAESDGQEPSEQPPFKTRTSLELMDQVFHPPVWIADGIIPEGLTILAGAPKTGKSWLALSLGVACSLGGRFMGQIQVDKLPCLYLALEDHPRRLQKRMNDINALPSQDLHFAAAGEWKQGDAGLEDIIKWKKQFHDETAFVIIDTLAKFNGPQPGKNGYSYTDDYATVGKIKDIADDIKLPIIVIHHTKKAPEEDPLFMVSGTTGLTGAADTTIVLTRARGRADAELHVDGRDIEEAKELALRFDITIGGWNLLGDAEEYRQSEARQDIMQIVREEGPITAAAVAGRLDRNANTVKNLMLSMSKEQLIKSPQKRGYVIS